MRTRRLRRLAARRSPDRLGHAHHFPAFESLRRFGLSLWLGVAALHGMGVRGRIPLPSRVSGLLRICGRMRCSAPTARSVISPKSFRRLLPVVRNQFASPDLVRGHGHQPDLARHVRVADRCGETSDHAWPRTFLRTGLRLQFATFASAGACVDFQYRKTADSIDARSDSATGTGDCWIEFSPAFSLRTQVVGVEMNGRPLPFKMQPNSQRSAFVRPVSCQVAGANNLDDSREE